MILRFSLIVFRVNFKVTLGMVAGRADLRCLLTDYDMTAVAALPHLDLALGKDLRRLYVAQQGAVALFQWQRLDGSAAPAHESLPHRRF